jgi:hypothetical protein
VFRRIIILLVFLAPLHQSLAQEIIVKGRFLSDSVKLGEPINFTLSARYRSELIILFPDSTFSFAPFEFQKKKYFPTKSKFGFSYDSVVYTLNTYEIDSLQFLRLPVFLRNPKDSSVFYSDVDTVFFKYLVKQLPDSLAANNLPLKANTGYIDVKWQFNTILFAVIGGVLIIVAILVWVIFGKRIKKYFAIKKLTKNHQEFLNRFGVALDRLEKESSPELAENALVTWKKYLEGLMSVPYTKFTSKEIRERENDERLGQNLKSIDRMIYARVPDANRESFASLKEYGEQKFKQRLEEVKHG